MNGTSTGIKDALARAVEDTFSEMAFLDAIPAELLGTPGRSQLFTIEVRGEQTHRLVLDLPRSIKQTIVENIHARPWEELASNDVDDCLLEFLNVLAGAFGRLYWGDDSRYRLSIPEVLIELPPESTTEWESYWYDTYGALFAVHLS